MTEIELHVVRCNQALPDGAPCMTLYPAESATHDGPCIYCWNRMKEAKKYSEFLEENKKIVRQSKYDLGLMARPDFGF